jgi:hypothetical protein
MVAGLAHERSLIDRAEERLTQVDDLAGDFDFAVNESCAQYGECEASCRSRERKRSCTSSTTSTRPNSPHDTAGLVDPRP